MKKAKDGKKKRILLSSMEEQMYLDNKSKLQESNLSFYLLFCKIMIVLLLFLYVSTFFTDYASSLMPIYILFIGMSVIELIFVSNGRIRDDRTIQAITYFGIGKAYLFCLLSSVVFNPNGPAITFHVFLILIPVAFIVRPKVMIGIQTGVTILYCILTVIFKQPEYVLADIMTVLLFYVISIVISAQITRLRLNNVSMANLATKHSQELEDNQDLLALAMENADMSVWEYDAQNQIIYPKVAVGGQKYYHVGIENMPDAAIQQGLICPDSIKKFKQIFLDAAQGKELSQGDIHSMKPDLQNDCWVHIRLFKGKKQGDKTLRYVGTTVDITDQKKVKNEYEEQIKMLDSINDEHLITKGQWNLSTNRQLDVYNRKELGLEIDAADTYDEASGVLVSDIIPEEKREEIERILLRKNLLDGFQKGVTTYALRYQRKTAKRDIIWVSMSIRLCKIPGINDIVAFAYSVDITDEVFNQNIIAKLATDQFELMGTVAAKTGRSKVRICNEQIRAGLETIGVYKNSMDFDTSTRIAMETVVPSHQREEIYQKLALSTIIARLDETGTYTTSFSTHENGKQMRKQMSYSYMDDTKEVILYSRSDITQLYELEQKHLLEMQESLKRAEEANAEKTRFLSNMSHDMRTPMNAILGFSDLGLDTSLVEEKDDYLKKIGGAGRNLLHLINDTLDVSRIENGKLTENREVVSSNHLLESVISSIRLIAEQKGIQFHVEKVGYENRLLDVDEVKLEKIFTNILSNAVKFTPKGGHVSLEVKTKKRNQKAAWVVITAQDDGAGMESEFLQHIYEPFMQEERTKSINETGTGLGLSIVKSLVDFLGGQISIESRKDQGTTIIVELKLDYAEKPQTIPAPPVVAPHRNQQVRILVCEDHPLNQEIISRLLDKKGYLYEIAGDGKEGVRMFVDHPEGYYSLILMDIRMPKMDGLEASRTIRGLDRRDSSEIPILAMTANAFAQDVRACLDAGMNAHLSKPIEPSKLFQEIGKYVR